MPVLADIGQQHALVGCAAEQGMQQRLVPSRSTSVDLLYMQIQRVDSQQILKECLDRKKNLRVV